jgi:hypothetical protein
MSARMYCIGWTQSHRPRAGQGAPAKATQAIQAEWHIEKLGRRAAKKTGERREERGERTMHA